MRVGDWAVTMPEPGGLALETARTAIDVLGARSRSSPLERPGSPWATETRSERADAVAVLAEAALG